MTRAACLAALLAGCLVGPSFERPAAPPATGYRAGSGSDFTVSAAGQAQRFVAGKRIEADWWRLFGSRDVDALVAGAIAANPGLDAARASLRRSESSLRAGYGVFFPQVDAQAGGAISARRRCASGRPARRVNTRCTRSPAPSATRSTSGAASAVRSSRSPRRSTPSAPRSRART